MLCHYMAAGGGGGGGAICNGPRACEFKFHERCVAFAGSLGRPAHHNTRGGGNNEQTGHGTGLHQKVAGTRQYNGGSCGAGPSWRSTG